MSTKLTLKDRGASLSMPPIQTPNGNTAEGSPCVIVSSFAGFRAFNRLDIGCFVPNAALFISAGCDEYIASMMPNSRFSASSELVDGAVTHSADRAKLETFEQLDAVTFASAWCGSGEANPWIEVNSLFLQSSAQNRFKRRFGIFCQGLLCGKFCEHQDTRRVWTNLAINMQ